MKTLILDVPEFGFIVGTRAALAAGIALMVGHAWPEARRRAVGRALVAVGVVSTIPAAMTISRGLRRWRRGERERGIQYDRRLVGAARFPRKGDDDLS